MSDDNIIPANVLAEALEKAQALRNAPAKFIATSTSYFNQDGLRIDENKVVSGVAPADLPRFIAHAVVTVDVPPPPGVLLPPGTKPRQHQQPIHAPLQAETIEQAFEQAYEALDKAAAAFQEDFQSSIQNKAASENIRRRLTQGMG